MKFLYPDQTKVAVGNAEIPVFFTRNLKISVGFSWRGQYSNQNIKGSVKSLSSIHSSCHAFFGRCLVGGAFRANGLRTINATKEGVIAQK